MCWYIEGTLSSFPPRILVIRFLQAKSLNFTAFNWKHTQTQGHTHSHGEGSTGPSLLITSWAGAALIINFYGSPPHTPHLPINPFFVLWILLRRPLFCQRLMVRRRRKILSVAFLLHSRVKLRIRCSRMDGLDGGECVSKCLRVCPAHSQRYEQRQLQKK